MISLSLQLKQEAIQKQETIQKQEAIQILYLKMEGIQLSKIYKLRQFKSCGEFNEYD